MVRVNSEWDLSLGESIFPSRDAAITYLEGVWDTYGLDLTLEEAMDENLISFTELTLKN